TWFLPWARLSRPLTGSSGRARAHAVRGRRSEVHLNEPADVQGASDGEAGDRRVDLGHVPAHGAQHRGFSGVVERDAVDVEGVGEDDLRQGQVLLSVCEDDEACAQTADRERLAGLGDGYEDGVRGGDEVRAGVARTGGGVDDTLLVQSRVLPADQGGAAAAPVRDRPDESTLV